MSNVFNENVNYHYEVNTLTLKDSLKELTEMMNKLHKEELEYYKLKKENRERRAAEGLPW